MNIKNVLLQSRSQFLILSIVLIILGSGIANFEGHFDWLTFILSMIGLVSLHASVNLLNDYSDYKTKIDFHTIKTPFSGGSKMIIDGKVKPKETLIGGIVTFGIGCIIGIYFLITVGLGLLPILILGAISILLYTTVFARYTVGEIFAGLGLGCLPVLGVYYVMAGHYSIVALIASIPSFFLTANLLFLNEFPDTEADKVGNRNHLVIRFGKHICSNIYAASNLIVYLWIILAVIFNFIPVYGLLSLITLPISLKAVFTAKKHYDSFDKFLPALGQNVLVVLITQFFLGIGFFLANCC